jgi:hypothetical protein
VSGFEPLTCRLQEVWPGALSALPAQIARLIAQLATDELGLFGRPFHEPFHATVLGRTAHLGTRPAGLAAVPGGTSRRPFL